jgi:hypothetical protein
MKAITVFSLLTMIVVFVGCAAHTNLEPVGKGRMDSNLSFGGPVVAAFGARIPVPYLTIGSNYGLSDRLNLDGNLHVLSMFYKVGGIDVGAAWFPFLNEGMKPTVGIQPRLLAFASLKSDVSGRFRFYPLISGSAAWKVGNGLFYTGFDLVVPASSQDFDDEATATIFSPFIGYRWNLGSKTRLLTEIKFHGLNVESDQLAVTYLHLGGHGALTTLFSLERSF